MDEIIIEKQKGELTEVVLELNQNTLITELKNLEVTPTSQEQTFKAGVGAFKEVKIKGDENLISENIKSGETIFGVEGNKNVVDTSDATATSSKIHPDCDAYVKGKKIKGGMTIWDNTKPRCTPTHQTIINPENPFILTRQQTTGERYEEIIKIPANVIDPAWLEGKNICIRANYNPNLTYWSKDWRIEIATVNDGGKFFFKVYSGGYMEIWARNAANKATNYTLYTANVDSIDELTIDSWKKKEVVADGYTNGDLGPIGTLYAYSRDDSGKTTSLTGSSGVPGSRNKFILKSANSKTGYTEANAEFYSEITHSDLAKKIKLKAEDIKEGKTYLGITGTLSDSFITSAIGSGSTSGWHSNIHKSITKIDGTNLIFGANMNYGFYGCTNLQTIENCDFSQVVNLAYGFSECTSLKTIKINAPNADTYNALFWQCSNLKEAELTLSPNATDARSVFEKCTSLVKAPLFETGKATSMAYFCSGCRSLTTLPEYNTSSVTAAGLGDFIKNCSQLTDESLDNMLKMCLKSKVLTNAAATWRTLKSVGFTQDQLARCTNFESYNACLAAGWSTGY